MSVEGTIQSILDSLTLSSEDRQSYTKDADEIRDFIIRRMKETNRDFARFCVGPSLTGSYLDDLKIDVPDEFDIHIKLELPDKITVDRDNRPLSCLKLKYNLLAFCAFKKNYPSFDIFTNYEGTYCIDREKLQKWIRNVLESIFDENEIEFKTEKSGRSYKINYSKRVRGYAIAHTLLAEAGNKREISFDFVPAFEFGQSDWISNRQFSKPGSPWFAVPFPPGDSLSFTICAPHLERKLLGKKNNLKNSLRLLKSIRDNNEMPHLTSYLLKTVYLWENDKRLDSFWEQPTAFLLAYMAEKVLLSLEDGKILFYWDSRINLLDRLKADELNDYRKKMEVIMFKLKRFSHGVLPNAEMKDLFM